MIAVFDFDDFSDETVGELGLLHKLRGINGPGFKVTLFTIPGRCTTEFLRAVKEIPWIELGIHGWTHEWQECQKWSEEEAEQHIKDALDSGFFAPVFRAPFWLWSEGTYKACVKLGVGIADHFNNVDNIPEGAKTYIWGQPEPDILQLHGHVTTENGNYIGKAFDEYVMPDAECQFLSEVLK